MLRAYISISLLLAGSVAFAQQKPVVQAPQRPALLQNATPQAASTTTNADAPNAANNTPSTTPMTNAAAARVNVNTADVAAMQAQANLSPMAPTPAPIPEPAGEKSYIAPPQPNRTARIGDIATIEGVRDNPLIGYGLVVGLNGTGDRTQTLFTTQMLGAVLQKMGTQAPSTLKVNNVAAVLLTATLPPFARPGTTIDVNVSSIGDAKSIEGGVLLLSPLRSVTGEVYATAQGAVTIGGFTAGGTGTGKQVNHPTAGRVPNGGIVERDNSVSLASLAKLSLLLRNPDFATSQHVADAINGEFHKNLATAIDSRRIEIDASAERFGLKPDPELASVPAMLGRIQALSVNINLPAKVVVNERTGTIVMGRDVRLGAVSILHGSLTIEISTQYQVSQPVPFSQNGSTAVVPVQTVAAKETTARRIELNEGATVQQLVTGLQTIGATARDVISILQAIKAAGALQADLEVL